MVSPDEKHLYFYENGIPIIHSIRVVGPIKDLVHFKDHPLVRLVDVLHPEYAKSIEEKLCPEILLMVI